MSTHSERTAPQRSSDATAVPRVAAVIVLAAGEGTRMKSRTSKILHEVAGESMISSALRAAAALEPQRLVVVVGHQRAQVEEHLAEVAPEATIAVQEQQNGTGDAVRVGLDALPADLSGDVVAHGLPSRCGLFRRCGVLRQRVPRRSAGRRRPS